MLIDVLSRLRAETDPCHKRLESRAGIIERAASPARRGELVQAFRALHAAADAVLAPWLGGIAGLAYAERRRLPLLDADLRTLDLSPRPVAQAVAPTSPAEALGMLYVLEGSTLGAQVIRRELARQGADLHGLSFLDPYGARTGAMWRGFLAVLAQVAGGEPQAAVRGGLNGFALAERMLAPAEAAA